MAELILGQKIQTARVQELSRFDAFGPLTLDSEILLNLKPFNKTVRASVQDLIPFFQTGGGAQLLSSNTGPDVIYEVPLNIGQGATIASLPQLAGKSFFLRRAGFPLKPGVQFDILSAGGFQLKTPGDVLNPGEIFDLFVYDLVGGSSTNTAASKPLITNSVVVSANTSYDPVNHANKLIRIRGGVNQITFTLPDINDVPANTIIPVEATINNSVEQKINTQAGQSIYFNGAGKTAVYARAGNVYWFYRDVDGYYDVTGSIGLAYDSVGRMEEAYKIGRNQLLLNGTELLRDDYPRLWEWAQTLGGSLVSDSLWQTASVILNGKTIPAPYRGCFSQGNGSTTFRLPDWMNMFSRAIKSQTGTDGERYYNKAGGYQLADTIDTGGEDSQHLNDGVSTGLSYAGGGAYFRKRGYETRPENIGVLKVINC